MFTFIWKLEPLDWCCSHNSSETCRHPWPALPKLEVCQTGFRSLLTCNLQFNELRQAAFGQQFPTNPACVINSQWNSAMLFHLVGSSLFLSWRFPNLKHLKDCHRPRPGLLANRVFLTEWVWQQLHGSWIRNFANLSFTLKAFLQKKKTEILIKSYIYI